MSHVAEYSARVVEEPHPTTPCSSCGCPDAWRTSERHAAVQSLVRTISYRRRAAVVAEIASWTFGPPGSWSCARCTPPPAGEVVEFWPAVEPLEPGPEAFDALLSDARDAGAVTEPPPFFPATQRAAPKKKGSLWD